MAGSKVRPAQYKSLHRLSANEKSHSCDNAFHEKAGQSQVKLGLIFVSHVFAPAE
jgi:hypothetical protein